MPFARPLHWRMNHRGQRALRDGNWKYLRVDGHDYLFDIPPTNANAPTWPAATRPPGRDARCLGKLERDHAAHPGGRNGEPGLLGAKDMPQR
jgi:hypothetical protein